MFISNLPLVLILSVLAIVLGFICFLLQRQKHLGAESQITKVKFDPSMFYINKSAKKRKKWTLKLNLILAITVCPLLVALILSVVGIYRQQLSMKRGAEGLAMKMTEELKRVYETNRQVSGIAANRSVLGPSQSRRFALRNTETSKTKVSESSSMSLGVPAKKTNVPMSKLKSMPMPSTQYWALSRILHEMKGRVAIFNSYGVQIMGIGDWSEKISSDIISAIKEGHVIKKQIQFDDDPLSALVIYPFEDGKFASAAVVSLYGNPDVKYVFMLVCAIIVAICAASFGVVLLIRYCIWPLQKLSSDIASLNLGKHTYNYKSPVSLTEISNIQAALRDLTLKAVDREIQKLRYENASVLIREDEREMLAFNIHDYPMVSAFSALQNMYFAKKKAAKELSEGSLVFKYLEKAVSDARLTIDRLNEACSRLAPLMGLDPGTALANVTKNLSLRYEIKINLSLNIEGSLPGKYQLREICNIIQLIVENSARVSRADNVDVSLSYENDRYVLSLLDNGSGLVGQLDFNILEHTLDSFVLHSLGYHSLAQACERAGAVGGTVSVSQTKGGPHTLIVKIPRTFDDELIRVLSRSALIDERDLEELSIELSREYNVLVTADITGDQGLLSLKKQCELCSLLRSAVDIAVRYRKAGEIRVSLVHETDRYVLTISHEGTGEFDASREDIKIAYDEIESRAAFIDGHAKVQRVGSETVITVTLDE